MVFCWAAISACHALLSSHMTNKDDDDDDSVLCVLLLNVLWRGFMCNCWMHHAALIAGITTSLTAFKRSIRIV